MKVYLFILTMLALCFALDISAQSLAESTPEVRKKTFEKAWQIVNEKYFDPKFGGADWKALHDRYEPLAAKAKTDAELYDVLGKMFGELKISHLELIPPSALEMLKQKPVITGLGIRDIDGQIVIAKIWKGSSAEEAGLRTGFIVTKIDGETIGNTDDAKRKLRGEPNTNVKITYLDQNNTAHDTTLQRRPMAAAELSREKLAGDAALYGIFMSSRLKDNIGYITFTNFLKGIDKKVVAAIESMKDARGVIIDLRGNGGGDDDVGIAMANALFEKPTQLMITRTRKGDDPYYKASGNKNAYKGKVVILLDEGSGSASEQFAAGVQESGRAVVIGKTSEGDDMDADLEKLPSGAYLIYPYGEPRTPKGVVVEGRGVIPDLEVKLTRESLLAGRDSQLDAAVNWIKTR